jgi:hypothetical protein
MNTNNNEHADELNQTMVYLDTQDTHTFLQASALDMDDEADYACQATNLAGSASSSNSRFTVTGCQYI